MIGPALVDRLHVGGRSVVALARSDGSAKELEAAGCTVVRGDANDTDLLRRHIVESQAEVVVNQLTALPKSLLNPMDVDAATKQTNQLRALTGPVVASAAKEIGAKLIVQSVGFAQAPKSGILAEDEPLHVMAPGGHRKVVAAISMLEESALDADGVVLRYGHFYGPNTYFGPDGAYVEMLKKRLLPIIGKGRGSFHLLHVDDAVDATVKAIVAPSGIYNVNDDERVNGADLLNWLAEKVGAPAPKRVPGLAFSVGPLTTMRYLFDEQPSVSNQSAKDVLGWQPSHPSWREPLAELLS